MIIAVKLNQELKKTAHPRKLSTHRSDHQKITALN